MVALPTDASRRRETQVWLYLVTQCWNDPGWKDVLTDLLAPVTIGVRSLLSTLDQHAMLAADRDVDEEALRLHALIDGLSVHLLIHPDRLSQARETLRAHLQELAHSVDAQE